MFLPSFRRLLGFEDRMASRSRLRPRVRPHLETLENRLVPATIHVHSGQSIQAAVLAANPGDTIQVDPGTYTEQVKISTNSHGVTLNNLKLQGAGQNSIIQFGSGAVVEISVATNVTLDHFTIQGTGSGPAFGVEVDSAASATISNDDVTQINGPNGVGILVGLASAGTTGTATITHDTIEKYQKGGIVVDNTGSSAEIDHTTVTGSGPTSAIVQNGIQISRGATADVNHDTVSGNVFTPGTFTADGILLLSPGAVTVDHNTCDGNDVGIDCFGATKPDIDHNECDNDTFNGIVLDTTTGADVNHNTTDQDGQGTFDPADHAVDGGIVLYSATSNTIDHNESKNNKGDGIFADKPSTGNTFDHNETGGNTRFDAEDLSTGTGTAGTANTWTQNHGNTSNPPGLVSH